MNYIEKKYLIKSNKIKLYSGIREEENKMNDIEKAIELLETINHNMKVDHMMKDMDEGVTKEEIKEYREDFRLINVAIGVLKKELTC